MSKERVKDAPKIDTDGHLSPQEEQELYRYYGMGTGTTGRTETVGPTRPHPDGPHLGDGPRGHVRPEHGRHRHRGHRHGPIGDTDINRHGTAGHDTSGPTTDDAMTRSEERIDVGTASEEAGRARLRKYVVSENVTQSVPVSREEVRVEREPITDANVGNAMDGPAISEEEHEVTLHAERAVVEKEAVPVERVRLDKTTVTEQEQVWRTSARRRSRSTASGTTRRR